MLCSAALPTSRSRSNPLPVSLAQECRKATKLFAAFANPEKGLDSVIPASILRKAKGFAFLTVAKAGFIFSARAGSGVVIARLPDGTWSAPSAIGTAGGGVGFQAGVEMAEFLIILNSRRAVASFMAAGSLTIGGNMSVAAGPLGRNVEGTGSLSTKGKVSAMYSYSRTKGLFGGASIEGSVIVERSDANAKAYGYDVTAKQLLSGTVEVPPFAEVLIDTIARRTGTDSDWLQDDDEDFRPDPSSGYAFATQYASGSSSGPSSEKKGRLGALGAMARSRSSSQSLSDAGRSRDGGESRSDSISDTFGFGRGGPLTSNNPKFEHHFTDDVDTDEWRSGAGAAMGKTGSAKLTKSRSSNGHARDQGLAEPQWSAEAAPTTSRDSFDSLDDQYGPYGPIAGDTSEEEYRNADIHNTPSEPKNGRFRSSTVGNSSARPSLLSRARSASSPFASFRSSNKNSPRTSRTASPSPFDDSTGYIATKPVANTKPWDSEDEDFLKENSNRNAPQYTPTAVTPKASQRGDPFDFRDMSSNLNNGSPIATASGQGTRSRSNTVGKGIGRAAALYDFAGVEPGDLPFRKGDVITILARDDEEWWKGRLAMREGIFPRNYVEADFD
ncbi:hypothetical protein OIV83_002491 [Microbotryomycetes sp. JL201]|nr:hypothetical protein OIV83_002491 [Microbotryomycetes sp. JL201]